MGSESSLKKSVGIGASAAAVPKNMTTSLHTLVYLITRILLEIMDKIMKNSH